MNFLIFKKKQVCDSPFLNWRYIKGIIRSMNSKKCFMNAFYSFPIFSEVPELPKENLSATKNEYPSVPHRPPHIGSTQGPHLSSTPKAIIHTPISSTPKTLSSTHPSAIFLWGIFWTGGFLVRNWWLYWSEGFLVWNWGGESEEFLLWNWEVCGTKSFLVLNRGVFRAEKECPFCVELMCWTEGVWNWEGPQKMQNAHLKLIKVDLLELNYNSAMYWNHNWWVWGDFECQVSLSLGLVGHTLKSVSSGFGQVKLLSGATRLFSLIDFPGHKCTF